LSRASNFLNFVWGIFLASFLVFYKLGKGAWVLSAF
jgi:hypothetical protein